MNTVISRVALALLLLAAILTGCSTEHSQTAALTYTNPVFAANMPDPSVKKFGHYYYAFGTTDNKRLPDGRIFTLLRSPDLVHWTQLGGALVPPYANASYQYWAPEITEKHGVYYLYYAVGDNQPEHFVIRVGVSLKPEGPYTDSGSVLTDCNSNRFTIDPYPFRDDDGQWYLFYACDFPFDSIGHHAGTGIAVQRLSDMTHPGGNCRVVVRPSYDWTLFETNREVKIFQRPVQLAHTIEGPCVIKHDGKYYCFYSGANWQTPRYGEDYVVADNPLGPYTDAGTSARVLHSVPGQVFGPGGATIVTGPDGKTQYIVYHAWNKDMTQRQMCIDKLEWTSDGPRSTPTATPQTIAQ